MPELPFQLEFVKFLQTPDGRRCLEMIIGKLGYYHSAQMGMGGSYGNHSACPDFEYRAGNETFVWRKHDSSPCLCCPTCSLLAQGMLWVAKTGPVFAAVPYSSFYDTFAYAQSLDAKTYAAKFGRSRKSVKQWITDSIRYLAPRMGLGLSAKPYDDFMNSGFLMTALLESVPGDGDWARTEVQRRAVAATASLCQLRAVTGDTHNVFPWDRVAAYANLQLAADGELRANLLKARASLAKARLTATETQVKKLASQVDRLARAFASRGIDWMGPDLTGDEVKSIVETVGELVHAHGTNMLKRVLQERVLAHLGSDDNLDAITNSSPFEEVEAEPLFEGQDPFARMRVELGPLQRLVLKSSWEEVSALPDNGKTDEQIERAVAKVVTKKLEAHLRQLAGELGAAPSYDVSMLAKIPAATRKTLTEDVVKPVVKECMERTRARRRRERSA